jgi:putative endonuclease
LILIRAILFAEPSKFVIFATDFGMWRSPVSVSRCGGMAVSMNYVVNILFSRKLEKYYVGHTNNIEKRLTVHNRKGKKYTSKGIPWVLIKTYTCMTRSEALGLELKIKGRGIKRYLDGN